MKETSKPDKAKAVQLEQGRENVEYLKEFIGAIVCTVFVAFAVLILW